MEKANAPAKIQKAVEKVESKVDYQTLEKARAEVLQTHLKEQLKALEGNKNNSMRQMVLHYTSEGHYKEAATTLDQYIEIKKVYPAVVGRCRGHVHHAKELLNAIRAKRNFPNLAQLSMSKQQEILDHAIGHFEELKATLKAIEFTVRDENVKDIRSTVWLVRTFVYSVLAVVVAGFIAEFADTLAKPVWWVFNDLTTNISSFILRVLPFI